MANRFRILVVDDEPVQRELVSGFLNKQGFEVIAADSAERALELFRQEAFDLILTDQKMANLSGLELLQAVHTINSETPVILITAFGTIEGAVGGSQARRYRLSDQTAEFGRVTAPHSTGERALPYYQ